MGNCCSQDAPPQRAPAAAPKKRDEVKEEDVVVVIEEEEVEDVVVQQDGSPPAGVKKAAGRRKLSKSAEKKYITKEAEVADSYEHRDQKHTPGWDPANPEDDCTESDVTKGQRLAFLIWNNERTSLAFFNNTDNLQITFKVTFTGCVMEPSIDGALSHHVSLPQHDADTGVFTVFTFPGETVPIAHGVEDHSWTGAYNLTYQMGPIQDVKYMEKVKSKVATRLEDDYQLMKTVGEELGIDVASIPPANSAEYDYKITHRLADTAVGRCGKETQFVDMAFPPVDASLGATDRPKCWVRPSDYLPEGATAALFVEGTDSAAIAPGDIDQGVLGDCWFMAALAACAEFPADLIIPMFKSPEEVARYSEANIYHVKLVKNGWANWYVVDGYLPCHAVPRPTGPCYAHNKQQVNELWVSLIEKAYAKVHGTYKNISCGNPSNALSDLTGYPSRPIPLNQDATLLYSTLKYHDTQQHCIYVTSPGVDISLDAEPSAEDKAKEEVYKEMGLVPGHAYSVLETFKWEKEGEEYLLVKVRNPWGTGREWTGSFRDTDPVWEREDEATKKLLEGTGKDKEAGGHVNDGTWWMEVKDLQRLFGACGACFVNLDWWDVRVKTGLTECNPNHIIELSPDVDTDALAWVTQPDKRGLAEGDPRLDWSALRMEVVKVVGDETETVAVSHSGVFMYGYTSVAFEANTDSDFDGYFPLKAGEKYYLYVRAHPGEGKPYCRTRSDLVLSYMTRSPCNTRVLIPTPALLECFEYVNNAGFEPSSCEDVSDAVPVQVNGTLGESVPWGNMASHEVKPQGRTQGVGVV